MTLLIGEILEGLKDLSPEQAIEYLKKHKSPILWNLLRETLNPQEFDRNVLDIQWTPSTRPMGLGETNLFFEIKRLYIFKTTSVVKLPRKKLILIQILESLHKTESGIYLSIISGTFYNRYTNLNPNDIKDLIDLNK